ncbi:MAG TPA: hypothetical protein VI298_08230 [Geobacteraceae bacterium]
MHMSWSRLTILWVSLSMVLSACGGGESSPGRIQMGGAVQGTTPSLTPAVSTLVGSSAIGSADGLGTEASFWSPEGITTDGKNLYVADSGNNTIRRVGIAFGNVSTIAGSTSASGAANGTGSAATFSSPQGITMDGTSLYVADSGNNSIRKVVLATRAVTTLAGTGIAGSTNDTGTAASFNNPRGITTDGANLYVADSGNNTIRKIVIATGVVTTLAGSPGTSGSADGTGAEARFNNPIGITTEGANLYVADFGNNTIRKIVISTGVVTTLAGSATGVPGLTADGTGGSARFNGPYAITSDGRNLYVTDDGCSVRKVTLTAGTANTMVIGPNGTPIVTTVAIAAGTVTTLAGSPAYVTPTGIVSPSAYGSADGTGTSISLATGVPVTVFGTARFWFPEGITTDGRNLFVADSVNNTIRKVY